MTEDVTIHGAADRPARTAPASSFTGTVLQDPLVAASGSFATSVTGVSFTPGARTNWHTHTSRQVLIATVGAGMVQVKGLPPHPLRPGDVAVVPPGVVHWHGAAPGSLFTHLSVVEGGVSGGTEWMEPVAEADYRGAFVG